MSPRRLPLALLLAAAACGGGSDPPPSEPAPTLEQLARDGRVPIGRTRVEIAAALGPADSVRGSAVPNRHDPAVTDTLYDVFYPGLRVGIHRPGGGGDLLASVEVRANRWLRFPAVGIGAPRERVRRALGTPERADESSLAYLCAACSPTEEPIVFHFQDGRVSRILFQYYVD